MAEQMVNAVGGEEADRLLDAFLAEFPPDATDPVAFLGEQFDRGLAWPHFPLGCGGLGVSPAITGQLTRRLQALKAPTMGHINIIGYGMVAPTIAVHGTDDQKDRYLRKIFTGEEIWCQLFSEPGAGSDVAGLATRALRDGEEWAVDGQKVWTSLAHLSKRGLLLARTDPDLPKHRGLTAFLVDMEAPGVEVRPLYQATGEAEFNEIFFTDAKVPDRDRLGEAGQGWGVAITTLMNERVSIGSQIPPRGSGTISFAVDTYLERWGQDDSASARVLRDRLIELWVAAECARLTNLRASQSRSSATPGPEGSVAKLAFAELNQRIFELCVDLMGPEGQLYANDYPKLRPRISGVTEVSDLRRSFIRSQANSIEGGTSIIMRNILAERVLSLPGEPRSDKDVPWSAIPRS
jgi:alkylation response protein AidB-like acyl-CoA dehydrogenase